MTMTKDEALKLALSTLDEVRQETFRLMRDGQKLYAEDKVWSTIISIKEVLAQPQRTWVGLTDEDVERIVREALVGEHGIGYTIARAIEAAHDIKE